MWATFSPSEFWKSVPPPVTWNPNPADRARAIPLFSVTPAGMTIGMSAVAVELTIWVRFTGLSQAEFPLIVMAGVGLTRCNSSAPAPVKSIVPPAAFVTIPFTT